MAPISLYLNLKDDIVSRILDGTYRVGGQLPTEQELCRTHGLSRVTVRKALEALKQDGLLTSVQGQGTLVSSRHGGYASSMDLIALIAPVHNPFFASFMAHFEHGAEANGSLVLFKQDFGGQAFANEALFDRLIRKNIRNVVFWPQSDNIDFGMLRRLRTVGMNMVFFDQPFDTDSADCVGIDNAHAVAALYEDLRRKTDKPVAFIGYEGLRIPSEIERERAFAEVSGGGDIHRIPWGTDAEAATVGLLDRLLEETGSLPASLLCCNGPIGIAAANFMTSRGLAGTRIGVIDALPEMARYRLSAYRQPMQRLAEETYRRLVAQNELGESWQAGKFAIRGTIVETQDFKLGDDEI